MRRQVKRGERLCFMELPGGEIRRLFGFTVLRLENAPELYSRRDYNSRSAATTVTGFVPAIDFAFDRYDGDPVHDRLAGILDGEATGSDAEVTLYTVELTAPVEMYGDEAARYLCSRRVYSAVPRESGADTELYAYSGSFTASGEELTGEAELSGDGESIRFYADE